MISYATEMQRSYQGRIPLPDRAKHLEPGLPPTVQDLLLRLRRSKAGGREFAEQLLAMLEYDPGLKRRIPARDLALLEAWKHAGKQNYAGIMALHYHYEEQARVPSGEHGGEFTAGHGNTTLTLKGDTDQHHDLMGKLLEASKETHAPKEKPKHPAVEQMRANKMRTPQERVGKVKTRHAEMELQQGGHFPEHPSYIQEQAHADAMSKMPEYKAWREAFEKHHGLGSIDQKMKNRKHFEAAHNALRNAWQRMLPTLGKPAEHAPGSLGGLFAKRDKSTDDYFQPRAEQGRLFDVRTKHMPEPKAEPLYKPNSYAQEMHDSWLVNYDVGTFGERGRFVTVHHDGDSHVIFIPSKQAGEDTHRRQLAKSKVTARKNWHQEAKAAGVKPGHLHRFARELMKQDSEHLADRQEMLKEARFALDEWSGKHRTIRASQGRSSKSIEDATAIRGLDEVAEDLSKRYPHLFKGPGNHDDQLFAMLEEGDVLSLDEETAYRHALDYLHDRQKTEAAAVPFQMPPEPVAPVPYFQTPTEAPRGLVGILAELAEYFKPQPTTVHVHPQITVQASTIPAPVVNVSPQIKVEQPHVTVRPEIKVQSPQITVQPASVVMPAHKAVTTEIVYDKSGRVTGKIERPTQE